MAEGGPRVPVGEAAGGGATGHHLAQHAQIRERRAGTGGGQCIY